MMNDQDKTRDEHDEKKSSDKTTQSAGADMMKLLHELEIQKIDLEMKNAALSEALLKSEMTSKWYNSLFRDNQSIMLLIDPESGDIKDANPAACLYYGWSHNEICTRQISDINIIPRDEILAEMQEARNEKRNYFLFRHRLASGDIRDVEVYSGPIQFNDATLLYSIVHDITERNLAEEELQRKTTLLSNLIVNLQEGILLEDANRKIVLTNQLFCDMFGIPAPPTVLIGADCSESAEQSKIFFRNPEKFVTDITRILSEKRAVYNEELELTDGRHFERDYIPTYTGSVYTGHLWKYRDVTVRKQTVVALQNSEALYRAIIQASYDDITLSDMEGNVTMVSPSGLSMFRYEKEEDVLGRKVTDFVIPAEHERVSQELTRMKEMNSSQRGEYRGVRSDGSLFDFEVTNNFIRDENGQSIGMVSLLRDITERKLVEAGLKKLSQAVEQSPVMTIITNIEGTIEYTNLKALELTGYTRDELTGKNPRIFSSGEKPQEEYKILWQTITSGKEWVGEFHNKKKNGEVFWVSVKISPIVDKDGKISHFLAVEEDITERKIAENNLRDSENRYRSIFQGSVDGILITDLASHKIMFANSAQCKMLGYTEQELTSMTIAGIHPEGTFEQILAEFERLANREKGLAENIPILRKNREIYFADIVASFITLNDKPHIVGFFRDVTGRKKAEDEIRDLNAALALTVDERTAQLAVTNENLHKQIAERNKAAANLEEALNRLQKIASRVPGVVYQFRLRPDGTSCFPYASEGIREIYRVNPEDVLTDGSSVFANLHPEDFNDVVASIQKSAKDQTLWVQEYRVKFEDGTVRWLLGNAMPQMEADGSVLWHGSISDITERKRAENELKQVSTRLSLAAQAGGVGVWDYDVVNNILVWDEQMFALYGITKETFSGAYEAWQAGLHPDDRLKGDAEIQMAIRGEKEFDTEFRVVWPDGSVHNIRANAIVQRDGSGKPMHLVGTNWDITAQKYTEGLIDQTRLNYETFFNTIDDFLFVLDEQGNMIHTNETVTKRLEYPADNLMGKSVLMVHPPERREEAGRIVGEMLAGTADFCPVPLITRSGNYIPVETRVKTGFWDGKPVIFGVSKDISKIKLSEEKFSKAFQSNSAMMAISDEDGRFLDVNDAFLRTLGYSREEILGQTSEELKLFKDPLLRGRIIDQLNQNIVVREVELQVVKKDNIEITGLFSADRIYIGKDMCLLTMMVDITARKQAEEEIRKARNEAEKANLAKSEFLSRMSHELRTPMNSILGFAQLMKMGELAPAHQKGVNHILTSGTHLLNLINEVLDISRIEAGRITLSLEPVQLISVIMEMIDIVTPNAVKRNLKTELLPSPTNQLFVKADRQRLKQVLLNLINNAVKYNREGGSVIIKTELQQGVAGDMSLVRISVIDMGVGISHEDLPKLFLPFERIGAERSATEGTGLGLAVVKKLMEAMGGVVGVDSIPGEGSTFWIELPLTDSQKIQIARTVDILKQGSISTVKAGSVLYIEDNMSNADLVEGILETNRPAIRLITSMYGNLAVSMAIENKPDLILLDLDLPDMHGSKVLENLQANPATREIPVVIISADAMPQQVERLMLAGARDYLTKPLEIVSFLKMVDEWI